MPPSLWLSDKIFKRSFTLAYSISALTKVLNFTQGLSTGAHEDSHHMTHGLTTFSWSDHQHILNEHSTASNGARKLEKWDWTWCMIGNSPMYLHWKHYRSISIGILEMSLYMHEQMDIEQVRFSIVHCMKLYVHNFDKCQLSCYRPFVCGHIESFYSLW